MLLVLWLLVAQMTSPSEEVDVWAWTPDYDMIVVEGFDGEPLYGLQNRHTEVIEVQEPVFSNAVNYLIEIQESYDSTKDVINEDGRVTDGMMKVTFKPKKEMH